MLWPESLQSAGKPKHHVENYHSLDNCVRPQQHIRRNRDPYLLGRFKIDQQLKFCRRLYWQSSRLRSLQNFVPHI